MLRHRSLLRVLTMRHDILPHWLIRTVLSDVTRACAVLVFSLSMPALGQDQLEPRTFSATYTGPFGKFSHLSAVEAKASTSLTVEYAVCNLDTRPLIYDWRGPNITVGDGGALPAGACHIVSRDVVAIDHDRRAVIAFTQAAREHPASALVSRLPLPFPSNLLPSFLENRLRTYFGPEGTAVQPSLAELSIVQKRSGGGLTYTISWYPPSVVLAIGTDAFAGQGTETVARVINNAGYQADAVPLDKVLAESSRRFVPEGRRQGEVIFVRKLEKSPAQLTFTLQSNVASISQSYVSVLNAGKLITGFEITSFSQ